MPTQAGGRGKKKIVYDVTSESGQNLLAAALASKLTRAMKSRDARTAQTADVHSIVGGDYEPETKRIVVPSKASSAAPSEPKRFEGGAYKLVVDADGFEYQCVVCEAFTTIRDAKVSNHPHLKDPVVVVCSKCSGDH